MRKGLICTLIFIISNMTMINQGKAQTLQGGKLLLDDTGEHYLKVSVLSQFWLRSAQYNPGSTLFGYQKTNGTDVGIRRFRMLLYGQLSNKVFFFSQLGINNFSSVSDRKAGFFVHDISSEYAVAKDKLSLGMGLSGWSGFSRFSSPSVGTIMGLDAPLFQQATNDVTDQFVRKLGIYARGKLGRLDYRMMVAQPLSIQKSNSPSNLNSISTFSPKPANAQWNGYFQYQFADIESNQTPYNTGTYLGKKSILNIGAGIVYQKNAMWHLADNAVDTISSNLLLLGVDVFYDKPIGTKGAALSMYLNYNSTDFGQKYIRNLGAMNPINGNNDKTIVNGGGIAFPAYGTGNVWYFQAGYKFRDSLIGHSTIMPYMAIQSASYSDLSSQMNYLSGGLTFLQNGHKTKLTVVYENRPVYSSGVVSEVTRKGCFIMQYQVSF